MRHLYRYILVKVQSLHLSLRIICKSGVYWMINRWPSFLAVVLIWLLPTPSPSPVSKLTLSVFLCLAGRAYWRGRWWGRSQIIQRRESPVLYKSFKNLCRKSLIIGFSRRRSPEAPKERPQLKLQKRTEPKVGVFQKREPIVHFLLL